MTAAAVIAVTTLLVLRLVMAYRARPDRVEPDESAGAVELDMAIDRARFLAGWVDGSARDWDRHVRPLLAGRVETAIGRPVDERTGRMLFGDLWPLVDPRGHLTGDQPGPGRAVFSRVLDRLEEL